MPTLEIKSLGILYISEKIQECVFDNKKRGLPERICQRRVGMRRISLGSGGRGASRTGAAPGSRQQARVSFELHALGEVVDNAMHGSLEVPDSSDKTGRRFERHDPQPNLRVERVEHP